MVFLLRISELPPSELSRRSFRRSSAVIASNLNITTCRFNMVDFRFSRIISHWNRITPRTLFYKIRHDGTSVMRIAQHLYTMVKMHVSTQDRRE